MRRRSGSPLLGAAAAALALAAATPASAVILISTWDGTFASGTDVTGVFGTPGRDLAGVAFQAVFTTDSETPGAEEDLDPEFFSQLLGENETNPTSAVVTILGRTFEFGAEGGYTLGFTYRDNNFNGSYRDTIGDYAESSSALGVGAPIRETGYFDPFLRSFVNDFTSWDYRTTASYVFQPGDARGGDFGFQRTVSATNQHLDLAFGRLAPTSVRVEIAGAAIPEPATWAMMIMGFGAMGVVMRRRRRQPSLA